MPTITIAFNVPDGQMPRLLAALRLLWGQVPDGAGGSRDMTAQEVLDRVRSHSIANLKKLVRQVEADAATKTALAAVTSIDAV